jgi:hypothetical protein
MMKTTTGRMMVAISMTSLFSIEPSKKERKKEHPSPIPWGGT